MTNIEKNIDVVAIGNAIVDILCYCDESLLTKLSLNKGSMNLVNQQEANVIYQHMSNNIECSGGSAANTMAGIASLGGKCGFIGKICDDDFGEIFKHDILNLGIEYKTAIAMAEESEGTACSLILVTPDADRTMQTYLGVAPMLNINDIDLDLISRAKILYIEGYLWDDPITIEAIRLAVDVAKKKDTKIALTLSDSFCVSRHKQSFLELITNSIDILFANDAEILELLDENKVDNCSQWLFENTEIANITLGDQGAAIFANNQKTAIAANPYSKVEDTTGAGDLFASGFLYGYCNGYDLQSAGELASKAAGYIVSHLGARPQKSLSRLFLSQAA